MVVIDKMTGLGRENHFSRLYTRHQGRFPRGAGDVKYSWAYVRDWWSLTAWTMQKWTRGCREIACWRTVAWGVETRTNKEQRNTRGDNGRVQPPTRGITLVYTSAKLGYRGHSAKLGDLDPHMSYHWFPLNRVPNCRLRII